MHTEVEEINEERWKLLSRLWAETTRQISVSVHEALETDFRIRVDDTEVHPLITISIRVGEELRHET
jgi:hypothetical protein